MVLSGNALKAGVWYTISNFLIRSIGLITTPIFTRIMSQSEYGEYANYTAVAAIAAILISLNLDASYVCAKYDHKEVLDRYSSSMVFLSICSASFWALLCVIFSRSIRNTLSIDLAGALSIVLYTFCQSVVNYYLTIQIFCFSYKKNILISTVISFGSALLSVFLMFCMSDKYHARIYGSILPTIILAMILVPIFIIKGKSFDLSFCRYALKISLPYIPHSLSLVVLTSTDRLIIAKYCSTVETGLYSLAYSIGSILMILFSSINQAYSPWLAENLHSIKYEEIRRRSINYLLIPFTLCIGAILMAPELLFFFGGEKYVRAKYVMIPVLIGCFFQFMYTMFVNIEQILKKTIGMAFASISAALLNLILNLNLIPRFGYIAAAYTTLIGYLWLLLVHMYLVYRIGYAIVYKYPVFFIVVFASLLINLLMIFLYINDRIRAVIGIIYFVFLMTGVYLKRTDLIRICKTVLK